MAVAAGARRPQRRLPVYLRLRYLLPLLLMGGLGWGAWEAYCYVVEAPRFRLAGLEVEGVRLLTGADVLRASGLGPEDNIFAVDLERVEARLEKECWIRRAEVRRKPPDRLVVALEERRRLAWIKADRVYGIDADGVLLPEQRAPGEEVGDVDLPVITGVELAADSLYAGAALQDSALARVLDWWREASRADPEFCMNVSEIQPLGEAICLKLVGDGLEVRLPADRAGQRLGVLRRMMERVYRECPDPAYIDLRFAGQVVVGSKERSS